MDAKLGVVASGSLTVEMEQMVSKLPSASQYAETLLHADEIDEMKRARKSGTDWACCPC